MPHVHILGNSWRRVSRNVNLLLIIRVIFPAVIPHCPFDYIRLLFYLWLFGLLPYLWLGYYVFSSHNVCPILLTDKVEKG